jgi:hypothetical protein
MVEQNAKKRLEFASIDDCVLVAEKPVLAGRRLRGKQTKWKSQVGAVAQEWRWYSPLQRGLEFIIQPHDREGSIAGLFSRFSFATAPRRGQSSAARRRVRNWRA